MNVASPIQALSRKEARVVASAVDHPIMTKKTTSTVRAFFQGYVQYVREVMQRSQQVAEDKVTLTDLSNPVQNEFLF